MANTNWENLPSTNTPINDENLNKISAGIVNIGTSVDSSYKTNILHSKNLFDKNNANIVYGSFSSTDAISPYNTNVKSVYISCKLNTTYTISKTNATSRFRVGTTSTIPASGVSVSDVITNDGGTTITITTNSSAKFLIIYYWNSSDSTDIVLNSLQIELGSTATTYEAFVPNSIYVNGNKFTETIGIGTNADSSKRFNVLKGEQLYNSSNVELGKTWQGNANNNRARLVLPISPNETYNIKVKGSGVQVAIVETAETPTSSTSSIVSYTYNSLSVNARYKAQSTTKYVTLQLDAGTTFTQAILNSLQISIFYGDCSIVVDNEEIYNQNIMNYSTSEIRIGTWIDDKPLYRKVYEILDENNSYTILKPDNLNKIVKLDIMQRDGDGAYISAYYWTSSDYLRIFYTNNYIQIRTSKSNHTFNHWITIEYTKTTD